MNRTYDLFERMPNGDVLWRASVPGVEQALKEVAMLKHVLTGEIVERIAAQQNRHKQFA